MELIVLGTGGGWARAGGAACGYLLRHDAFHLWVDLGTGTMANLQRYAALEDVDAVIVSHRHFDHFVDIYPFWLARWGMQNREPIPLFAPPGMFEHALQLTPELTQAFDIRVVEPGERFTAGPFEVRTAPMRHPVPTLGMRFEADGAALCYSADTGPTDALVELAAGAQALLSEATWIDKPPAADPVHLTAAEAGEAGRRAGVGRLLITHVWPANPMDRVAELAATSFGDAVTMAIEGMRLQVR